MIVLTLTLGLQKATRVGQGVFRVYMTPGIRAYARCQGGQGSRMQLATLGEEADEVGFLGVADEGGDAKGISREIACGHIRALP